MSAPSALQVALGGLGIDLQAELTRYRRARCVGELAPVAPTLPDDYLASSEQLLQQIAASEPPPRRRRPWAVASAAAIVCALGLLSRSLRHPAAIPVVGPASPATGKLTASTLTAADRIDDISAGLAALPHIQVPADAKPANTSQNDGEVSPEISLRPTSELAVAARPDLEANFFYVTLEYSASNLARVREWVPDAFVVKFPAGNLIQAGAFYRRDRAEQAVEQLRQHQLVATVYQP